MKRTPLRHHTPLKETEIQRAICDYLAYTNHFFFRNNNTPIYDPTRKAFRAMPKYTKKGLPDIILVYKGRFIGLEVKTPKGTQSDAQKAVQREIEASGGVYAVVTSIDDAQHVLSRL